MSICVDDCHVWLSVESESSDSAVAPINPARYDNPRSIQIEANWHDLVLLIAWWLYPFIRMAPVSLLHVKLLDESLYLMFLSVLLKK